MPVEPAADRLAFVDTAEFAVTASYVPAAGGAPRSLAGVFDSDEVVVDLGGEATVQSRQPRLTCRVDDLDLGGRKGDTVSLSEAQLTAAGLDRNAAGTYKVATVKPDGTGMVLLILELQ